MEEPVEIKEFEECDDELVKNFKKFLFIPDVIKTDKKIHFFGIPKFGS